jgi:hypothetical protein
MHHHDGDDDDDDDDDVSPRGVDVLNGPARGTGGLKSLEL